MYFFPKTETRKTKREKKRETQVMTEERGSDLPPRKRVAKTKMLKKSLIKPQH